METTDQLQALCRLATLSNYLAKKLDGYDRALAYRLKTEALSALITGGWATPNGAPVQGIVGLDIASNPPARLHIPLHYLSPEARTRVCEQLHLIAPIPQKDEGGESC
jgi:hypothetical protein